MRSRDEYIFSVYDFFNAIRDSNLYVARQYISKTKPGAIHRTHCDGETALIWASRYDCLAIVEALLAVPGANFDAKGIDNRTAAEEAFLRGHMGIYHLISTAMTAAHLKSEVQLILILKSLNLYSQPTLDAVRLAINKVIKGAKANLAIRCDTIENVCLRFLKQMINENDTISKNVWIAFKFLEKQRIFHENFKSPFTNTFYVKIKSDSDQLKNSFYFNCPISQNDDSQMHDINDYCEVDLTEKTVVEAAFAGLFFQELIVDCPLSMIKKLVENNPYIKEMPLLPFAVISGDFKKVRFFLQFTKDINYYEDVNFFEEQGKLYGCINNEQSIPVLVACSQMMYDLIENGRHIEDGLAILQLLIAAGADPDLSHGCPLCDSHHSSRQHFEVDLEYAKNHNESDDNIEGLKLLMSNIPSQQAIRDMKVLDTCVNQSQSWFSLFPRELTVMTRSFVAGSEMVFRL